MNFLDALLLISAKKKDIYTFTNIAKALKLTPQYVNQSKDKELTDEQISTLEKEFDVDLRYQVYLGDAIEIDYYENKHLEDVIKHPRMKTFSADRELIAILGRNVEDIKIMCMPGDAMNGGTIPFKNRDILMIDTSKTNPVVHGIYAYTSQNDTLLFVSGIRQKGDGSLEFYYNNPELESVTYSPEKLKEMDFKIIGKVFKNICLQV